MSGVTIEEKRPIIQKKVRRGRPFKYPYETLEVGQTFFVAGDGEAFEHKVYLSVRNINKAAKRDRKEPKFRMHRGEMMGSSKGIRVQRIR
jgi:hypothetical protein